MVEIAVSGLPESVAVGEEVVAVVTATGLGQEKSYSLEARIDEQVIATQRIQTDDTGEWSGEMSLRTLNNEGINILTIRASESDTVYWDSQVSAINVENRVLGTAVTVAPTLAYNNPPPLPTAIGGVLLGIVVAIAVIMAVNGFKTKPIKLRGS